MGPTHRLSIIKQSEQSPLSLLNKDKDDLPPAIHRIRAKHSFHLETNCSARLVWSGTDWRATLFGTSVLSIYLSICQALSVHDMEDPRYKAKGIWQLELSTHFLLLWIVCHLLFSTSELLNRQRCDKCPSTFSHNKWVLPDHRSEFTSCLTRAVSLCSCLGLRLLDDTACLGPAPPDQRERKKKWIFCSLWRAFSSCYFSLFFLFLILNCFLFLWNLTCPCRDSLHLMCWWGQYGRCANMPLWAPHISTSQEPPNGDCWKESCPK